MQLGKRATSTPTAAALPNTHLAFAKEQTHQTHDILPSQLCRLNMQTFKSWKYDFGHRIWRIVHHAPMADVNRLWNVAQHQGAL